MLLDLLGSPSMLFKLAPPKATEYEEIVFPTRMAEYIVNISGFSISIHRVDQRVANFVSAQIALAANVTPAYVPYGKVDLSRNPWMISSTEHDRKIGGF